MHKVIEKKKQFTLQTKFLVYKHSLFIGEFVHRAQKHQQTQKSLEQRQFHDRKGKTAQGAIIGISITQLILSSLKLILYTKKWV